jgi:hypothetical protein
VKAWRIGLATLATGLALGGCAAPSSQPVSAAPAVSYDGTYTGALTLTGVGAGVPREGCATSPQMTLQVKNNAFTYVQPHPNSNVTAPGMPTVSATAYTVAVAPNGTFSGQSDVAGTMTGAITGTHMTGTIEGIVCVYSFTADRT